MDMTLDSYIANPLGKNNATFNAVSREAIKNDYMKKFDALMVREHGNIVYHLYHDEKNNKYYAHIKVPSETVNKFYYDVVFQFYTDQDVKEAGKNLGSYYVKFFSNDPAFNYTYTYAFFHQNLIIPELKNKLGKRAKREKAKEKNPGESLGYSKIIYLGYLTLLNRGLLNRDRFVGESHMYSKGYLSSQVEDADIKIAQREREGEKVRKQKKKEKLEARKQKTESDNIKSTKRSNIVTTKKINSSVKAVKKTKRK